MNFATKNAKAAKGGAKHSMRRFFSDKVFFALLLGTTSSHNLSMEDSRRDAIFDYPSNQYKNA